MDECLGADDEDLDGVYAIYMLRTMQQHHVQLSSQADQKASMLIGAAAVIMTLIFRDASTQNIALPLLCIAGASFVAAVLAIAAVVPLTKSRPGNVPNMMFFGSFIGLDEPTYQARMAEEMASNATVRRAMVRDVYQLGQVLGRRKYRLIGHAYRVFLLGLAGGFLLSVAGLAGLLPH